jgi:hypothetical protein
MQIADCTSEAKMKLIEIMCILSAAVNAVESGTADATMTALVATANNAPRPRPRQSACSHRLLEKGRKGHQRGDDHCREQLDRRVAVSRRRSVRYRRTTGGWKMRCASWASTTPSRRVGESVNAGVVVSRHLDPLLAAGLPPDQRSNALAAEGAPAR